MPPIQRHVPQRRRRLTRPAEWFLRVLLTMPAMIVIGISIGIVADVLVEAIDTRHGLPSYDPAYVCAPPEAYQRMLDRLENTSSHLAARTEIEMFANCVHAQATLLP